ncbi:MAG TPA: alpha/beta hydrolase [Verrucomicrobiae bacterium]|nr:alpha/beta hydrolase [Verrucomicrobiae bacterium]
MERLETVRIPPARSPSPTLVFLHEGLGSAALWRNFPARVAERSGLGALVYSRCGNGFSERVELPRTPEYMHDEALVELPRLLDEFEIGDTVLVGHSDGASIALIFAAEFAERVRAVVVLAPHLFVEEHSLRSIAEIRERFETTALRQKMARYHADPEHTFYGWNDVWLSPEFRDWNIEAYAARVRAPVLAVQGLDDEYGTLLQLERLRERAQADVDCLLLAGCGHAPHLERPASVEAAVAGWIEEQL